MNNRRYYVNHEIRDRDRAEKIADNIEVLIFIVAPLTISLISILYPIIKSLI